MKRPIALLASLLAVTVLATAAAAAGGDSSDPLISLNYLQTVFTAKANSSIDASLDKTGQTAYTQAETVLRSTVAASAYRTMVTMRSKRSIWIFIPMIFSVS